MRTWRCRLFGHDLEVEHAGRRVPLWAARYLLAWTATRGCTLLCTRCPYREDGLPA